jgi:uroporphyrinogen decarboxylase
MNGEKLTPAERWKALMNGDPVDRVCVFPWAMGHTALINGHQNLGEYYEKPEVTYKCQTIAKELYGYEQPLVMVPPGYGGTEWGSKMLFPYNPKMGSISVIESVVKTPEDVEKIEVPDPKTAPYYKEFTEACKKAVAEKRFPAIWITGGWVTNTAAMVADLQTFMRWMVDQPDVAKKILIKTKEFALRELEHFVRELGADNFLPFSGNPSDSNALLSPKSYGEIVLPNMIDLFQKGLKMGIPTWFVHYCGDHRGNIKAGHIEKLPLGKPGILQFGPEVDLKYAVERFGKMAVVMGNVDPPSMLLKSFDDCLQLAKQDIEKGKHSPKGYILGVGCELPPKASPANVYALIKAAREYGRY